MSIQNKLMLVDGNSILNRAFYGLQGTGMQLLQTSRGEYTNAVFGFLNTFNMYLEAENPNYLCVAFDLKAPTFRHKKYDKYKANRTGMPDDLAVQVPLIKEVLDAMNICHLECEGYEADDLIGCVSICAEEEGLDVVIITGDKDSLQLASDKTRILLPVTRSGITETREYDSNIINEVYGIEPWQFIEVKGLMGDTSDNIPGIKGIGEKTALKLIHQFGTIQNIYDNLDKVERKAVRNKLEGNHEIAMLSRELSEINRCIPDLCNVADLKRVPVNKEALYDVFKRLEFKSFIEKYDLGPVEKPLQLKSIETIEGLDELDAFIHKIYASKHISIIPFFEQGSLYGLSIAANDDDSVFVKMNNGITTHEFLCRFQGILKSDSIEKYGHDIKEFLVFLKQNDIVYSVFSFDSMIAAYLLNSSRTNYDISGVSQEFLGIDIVSLETFTGKGKKRKQLCEIDNDELSSIAGMYAETIFKLKDVMNEGLENNGQEFLYYEIELPLVEVLADMEFHGFKVNTHLLEELSSELREKIDKETEEIYQLAGQEFNINSPKQLGAILFVKLGLPVIKKTKTGYSTSAEVLDKLSGQHEIIDCILYYRQLVKLQSTYVDGLLNVVNRETSKIYTSFNQTVVVTGRISSTEPNLQNIPIKLDMGRNIRKVFVPSSDDYLLVDADYSQIELRVLAHITEDENMISAFKHDADIHTMTAAQIFGITPENVTPSMRSSAKAVNFGIVYGIGEFSLSQDLGITVKEAKKYIQDYLDRYPRVKEYMKNIVIEGKEHGNVKTIFNRRRYLPELQSRNFNIRSFGERIAMNTPIQGSAADIIKIAMVKVNKALKDNKMKSRMILQVHDELVVETHKDEISEVKNILLDCMENAVQLKVPLIVDLKTGNNWYETM